MPSAQPTVRRRMSSNSAIVPDSGLEFADDLDTRFAVRLFMIGLLLVFQTEAAAFGSIAVRTFRKFGGCFVMTKAHQEKTGLTGQDKSQGDLRDADKPRELPEGLKRERKGPLDKNEGRGGGDGA